MNIRFIQVLVLVFAFFYSYKIFVYDMTMLINDDGY